MEESAQTESSTNEAQTPKPTAPQPTKPKASKKPIIITAVVALVLIILVVGGIYLWQQGIVKGLNKGKDSLEAKVVSQSAQLKTLEENNKDLNAKINFLDKALKEATAAANIDYGELTFSTSTVKFYDYGDESGKSPLIITITAKNDTEYAQYLSNLNFKLKDDQNKSYPRIDSGYFTLPKGYVWLTDQQVNIGETVVGTIAFWADEDKSLFTLYYNTQKFTIAAK